MSAVSTFIHLLVGLAGASLAAYGGMQVGDDKLNEALNKKCAAAPIPAPKAGKKAQTKAQQKAACDLKYPVGKAMLHKIMMYGGCGLIVVVFVILWFLGTSFGQSLGQGQFGQGYGGQYYGQQ